MKITKEILKRFVKRQPISEITSIKVVKDTSANGRIVAFSLYTPIGILNFTADERYECHYYKSIYEDFYNVKEAP